MAGGSVGMRTAIKAGWIVGHEKGAHTLIRNGVLIYEANKIIHVGHTFAGPVDERLDATCTVAELLRNGVTTFVEFGSQLAIQDALLAEVTRLGMRAYLAPGYDCGRWVGDEKGRLKR